LHFDRATPASILHPARELTARGIDIVATRLADRGDESRIAQEFTIRDGLIVRVKVHRDRGEALRAMGLAE